MASDNDRAIYSLATGLGGVISSLLQLQRAVIEMAATIPEERRSAVMVSINASIDELSQVVKKMGGPNG